MGTDNLEKYEVLLIDNPGIAEQGFALTAVRAPISDVSEILRQEEQITSTLPQLDEDEFSWWYKRIEDGEWVHIIEIESRESGRYIKKLSTLGETYSLAWDANMDSHFLFAKNGNKMVQIELSTSTPLLNREDHSFTLEKHAALSCTGYSWKSIGLALYEGATGFTITPETIIAPGQCFSFP